MTRNRWIIFIIVCALALTGLVVFTKKDSADVSKIDASKIVAGENGDHVYGNKDARVVLYEYGDFACPGCGGAYPQLKAIKEKYKSQIAFVFRNFPLTSIHPNALAAATAAEAAGQQGKFWEMHDKLYENREAWSGASANTRGDYFTQYASAIGLDMDKFNTDLTSKTVSEKISRDRALGTKQNVDSTPTLFVNGEKVSSEAITDVVQKDGSLLTKQIDEKLKAAGVALPESTPAQQ